MCHIVAAIGPFSSLSLSSIWSFGDNDQTTADILLSHSTLTYSNFCTLLKWRKHYLPQSLAITEVTNVACPVKGPAPGNGFHSPHSGLSLLLITQSVHRPVLSLLLITLHVYSHVLATYTHQYSTAPWCVQRGESAFFSVGSTFSLYLTYTYYSIVYRWMSFKSVECLTSNYQLKKTSNWLSPANPTDIYACQWSSLPAARSSTGSHFCQLDFLGTVDYIVFVSWQCDICSKPALLSFSIVPASTVQHTLYSKFLHTVQF